MRGSRTAIIVAVVIFYPVIACGQNLIATPKDWVFTYIQGAHSTRAPRPSVIIPTNNQSGCISQPGSSSLGYWKYHLSRDGQKCWYPSTQQQSPSVVFREPTKNSTNEPNQLTTVVKDTSPPIYPPPSNAMTWTLDPPQPTNTTIVAKNSTIQQNAETITPEQIVIPIPHAPSGVGATIAFMGVAQIILLWVILHMVPKFDRRKKLLP